MGTLEPGALRGRDPTCKICGHRKSKYEYELTRTNRSVPYATPEIRKFEAYFCNRCDFNKPYDPEPGDGR